MSLSIMPDMAPKTAGKSRIKLESAASIDSKIQGRNLPVEDAGTEATTQEHASDVKRRMYIGLTRRSISTNLAVY